LKRWAAAVMLAIVVMNDSPMPGAAFADGAEWVNLGPIGPGRVTAVAAAPGWPSDPLILASRSAQPGPGLPFEGSLVRSRDGGKSWEVASHPAASIGERQLSGLRILAAPAGQVVLAFQRAPVEWPGPWHVWRSIDYGDSWDLSLEGDLTVELAPSPDFQHDGLVFASVDGWLRRSRDAGATWEPLDPVPGQDVHQVVFSPAFADDHLVYLAAITGELSIYSQVGPDAPVPPLNFNARSQGIFMSTDGGDTWTASNIGLGIEDVPYRNVQALAISPTFARDGTLFAAALGPYRLESRPFIHNAGFPRGRARLPYPIIFRSRDRGQTWERVADVGGETAFGFSPMFADDGVIMRAQSTRDFTPVSQSCSVWRSTDAGTSWTKVSGPSLYEWCRRVVLLGSGPTALVALKRNVHWEFSEDGGLTWGPDESPSAAQRLTSWIVAPDVSGTGASAFLVGAEGGGVWLYGPGVTTTEGR
jgi:hypothetical protein